MPVNCLQEMHHLEIRITAETIHTPNIQILTIVIQGKLQNKFI